MNEERKEKGKVTLIKLETQSQLMDYQSLCERAATTPLTQRDDFPSNGFLRRQVAEAFTQS